MDSRKGHPGGSQPGPSWAGSSRTPQMPPGKPRTHRFPAYEGRPVRRVELREKGENRFRSKEFERDYGLVREEKEIEKTRREEQIAMYLKKVEEEKEYIDERVINAQSKPMRRSDKENAAVEASPCPPKRTVLPSPPSPKPVPPPPPLPIAFLPRTPSSGPASAVPSPSTTTSTARSRRQEMRPSPLPVNHPPHFNGKGEYLRLYKLVVDPNLTNKKNKLVRRFNGKCEFEGHGHLEFHQLPTDPRNKYRRNEMTKGLIVPRMTIDDQYKGIPPRREVTLSNLNDNVNKEFLIKMAKNQKLDPEEVVVYYNPTTRKHLQMGIIVFKRSPDAAAFVEKNEGKTIMGNVMECTLDPFGAHLNRSYTMATGESLPPLIHLAAMSSHSLSLIREELVGPIPDPAAIAAEQAAAEAKKRSLSPMDTSNSPPGYANLPPPPPPIDSMQPIFTHVIDPYGGGPPLPPFHIDPLPPSTSSAAASAAAAAAAMPSPPPPYSELPPSNHRVEAGERYERSTSRKRSVEPEGSQRTRREKRRRASTSSSSSNSSRDGRSSSRRSDGGMKKSRKEEYLKVKRYVSSERDSNGDKRIVKEVKTVTYKRRTEQRTTRTATPDSFEEEMERRAARSMSRGKRGTEDTGWTSPSSESDPGTSGRRKKRTNRDHSTDQSEERKPPPPSGDATPSAAATPRSSSVISSGGSRRRGFDAPPPPPAAFDPSQPPPAIVVPPVGLVVLPDCSVPPPPPPTILPPSIHHHHHLVPPPPLPGMMMKPGGAPLAPPPLLPGGFIPPPELFGFAPTPAMYNAASYALATGLPPSVIPLPPPPPGMMMMGGGGAGSGYGSTPSSTFSSPAKGGKLPSINSTSSPLLPGSAAAAPAAGITRGGSASGLQMMGAAGAAGGRTPKEIKALGTPPTSSDGGSTPATAAGTPAAEKKVNLDDRLSQLFGLKKTKTEEEKGGGGKGGEAEMKHAASAPSISAMSGETKKESDDMDVDSDDMDVASSSSETAIEMKGGVIGGGGWMEKEKKETEEEKKLKEEVERKRKEDQAAAITRKTVDTMVNDLFDVLKKDIMRKMEVTAFARVDLWEKKAKMEQEEKKKEMLRMSLAAAAASDTAIVTPRKDPMEEMLAAKLLSPEGLSGGGISTVFSSISMIKRKRLVFESRDGTPVSRDSREQSRGAKSRSASRSTSRSRSLSSDGEERRRRRGRKQRGGSSSTVDSSSSSDEESDTVRRKRKGEDDEDGVRRRPNMRNIESSQESDSSSASSSSSSEEDSEDEKENVKGGSPLEDEDVDVTGMSEDEVEDIKREIKEEEESISEPGPSSPAALAATSTVAAAVAAAAHYEVQSKGIAAAAASATKPQPPPVPAAAAPVVLSAAALLEEQMRHLPTMRLELQQPYDPIRHDHCYIKQIGIPFVPGRTIQPPVRQLQQQQARFAAAAAAAGGAIRPAVSAAAAASSYAASAAAVASVVDSIGRPAPAIQKTKKKPTDKIPHELLALLPSAGFVGRKKAEDAAAPPRSKKVWKKRTVEEERRILESFKAGMDGEDEEFTRRALEEMQVGGARPWGGHREIKFVAKTRHATPLELSKPKKLGKLEVYYDDDELAGIVPHSTGCARTEGFYRLTFKQKIRIMRRPETAYQDRTEINERDEVVTRHTLQAQKEQRSMNRRLQTMVDSNPNSEFFKVNQLKYRKKMIKFARSRIHGWGLYALEPIAPDDMIVEYIGQKIRPIVADEREKQYERRGIGSSYLFRIDEDEVIDATKQGNFARFINHSCQPNCYAKVVTVDGDKRIVIYSKSLIQKGDEITYDYKFPLEEDKIECLCGAPLCRGTLN